MSVLSFFKEVPDPRQDAKVHYDLSAILFVTLCTTLSGAQSWQDIALFAKCKKDWLSDFVDLGGKVPSLWTFRRIFTLVKPEFLEYILQAHADHVMGKDKPRQISIDGKALCGSKRHNIKCLKSLTAWCNEKSLVLAEKNVDSCSNETVTIPFLLDVLDIKGTTVSIDAAGCYKSVAKKIRDQKGDYVLALKKNQPKLYKAITDHIEEVGEEPELRLYDKFDHSHGRSVRRRCFAYDITSLNLEGWDDIKTAIAVETISSPSRKGDVTANWRYYISSHPSSEKDLPDYIRNHWGIENRLHWVLDVHLQEDNDRKSERRSAKTNGAKRRTQQEGERKRQS